MNSAQFLSFEEFETYLKSLDKDTRIEEPHELRSQGCPLAVYMRDVLNLPDPAVGPSECYYGRRITLLLPRWAKSFAYLADQEKAHGRVMTAGEGLNILREVAR